MKLAKSAKAVKAANVTGAKKAKAIDVVADVAKSKAAAKEKGGGSMPGKNPAAELLQTQAGHGDGLQDRRFGHPLRVGSGEVLGNRGAKEAEKPFPIGRHRAVRSPEIHGRIVENRLAGSIEITLAYQFRAVHGPVVREEIQVIRLAAESFRPLDGSGGIHTFRPLDDKCGKGAVLEREIRQERVERMTIHPVTERRIDDPDAVRPDFGDGYMDEV